MNCQIITRSDPIDNGLGNDIRKLEEKNISFKTNIFEYNGPQDFILYKIENTDIKFAMKVLFCSNQFKIVNLHYDNQLVMLLSFVEFRSLIIKNYKEVINSGKDVKILWDKDICSPEIKNFARLSNIMGEEESLDYIFDIHNKDKINGKDIQFSNSFPFPLSNYDSDNNNSNNEEKKSCKENFSFHTTKPPKSSGFY